MAITSGFFDSSSGDRLYSSDAFNQLFDGILSDGVIAAVGGGLIVTAVTGMTITVATGRAWFQRSWIDNNSSYNIVVPTSSPGFGRIDIIAMDFDKTSPVRANTIILVQGTASATPVAPTLVNETDHIQIPLAEIFVGAGVSQILQANITNKIGTTACPYASGLLQQLTTDNLILQWQGQFYDWFNNLVDQLTGVQVTNLQAQIDLIEPRLMRYRNLLINGGFNVIQRLGSMSVTSTIIPLGMPDRWYIGMSNCGTIVPSMVNRTDNGITRPWYRMTASIAKPVLDPSSYALLSQRLEAQTVQDLYYGSTDAKEVTISFLFRSNVTGTYVVELNNVHGATFVSSSFAYSVSEVTQKVELTFPPEVTNDILSDTTEGMRLSIWAAAGTNYTSGGSLQTSWGTNTSDERAVGQVNFMSAANNYVMYADIQLEVGPKANLFERLPYDVELKRCQRYYYATPTESPTYYQYAMMYPINIVSSLGQMIIYYPVEMRDVPSYTPLVTQYQISSGGSFGGMSVSVVYSPTKLRTVIEGQCNQPFTAGLWSWHGRVRYVVDAEL